LNGLAASLDERIDDYRVELGAAATAKLGDRAFLAQGRPLGPCLDHRVERVPGGDDPREE
jgi:hypothetical protein